MEMTLFGNGHAGALLPILARGPGSVTPPSRDPSPSPTPSPSPSPSHSTGEDRNPPAESVHGGGDPRGEPDTRGPDPGGGGGGGDEGGGGGGD
jgi:hypothetical protein